MICILHGWLLEGSGSNLWTRSIVTALARAGETVHLMCQENHPQLYDCIGESYRYDEECNRHAEFVRETPYPGRCIMHHPWIGDTLPVFVWDEYEEYEKVVPMIDLPVLEVEAYVNRNVRVLTRIVRDYGITAIHANHAVPMSMVAQRVRRATGVPFAIMPHGSGIEYAVKKDRWFAGRAASAFVDAAKVFVIGSEMRDRVKAVFPHVPGLDEKFIELHLGVDTSQFELVARRDRPARIARLAEKVAGTERGKSRKQTELMLSQLSASMDREKMRQAFIESAHYNPKLPDEDLEKKLGSVDWIANQTLLFTGRIISMKGIQTVVAALPLILQRVPDLRLIVVGHGPLREPMEALVHALESGSRDIFMNIVKWGKSFEGDPAQEASAEGLSDVAAFLSDLESRDELDDYFERARRHVRAANVIFTGYLTHNQLRHLFPCCDAGVFPSIVREAGPLVFLEALASGCFPLGTYFGGMKASIDSAATVIPQDISRLMMIDPGNPVRDIASHVPPALTAGQSHREALAQLARDKYDWTSVGSVLRRELGSLEQPIS
jgi:glycosyltransferase involved in cell wall biosynthesis